MARIVQCVPNFSEGRDLKKIEDKMKAQKMQQEVTGGVSASPKEVRNFFYKIPFDSIPFISSKVKISQMVVAPEISYNQKELTKTKLLKIKNRINANEISFRGCEAIAKYLKSDNCSLESLHLSGNKCSDYGAKAIA